MRIMNDIEMPSAYQRVAYIESTGTQYIEIDFSPTANTKVEYKVKTSSSQTVASAPIIGTRVGNGNPNRFFPLAYSGTTAGRITFGNKEYSITFNADTIYEGVFDAKNQTATLNGQTYNLTGNSFTKSENTNLCVFGTNGYGSEHYIAKATIYYCKIYENNVLVRNLIPCVRKSDTTVGLFDTLTKTFYAPIGTNMPTSGAEKALACCRPAMVTKSYDRLDYIESSGSQYIDLDYICKTTNIKIELDLAWTGTNVGAFETFIGFMYSTSQVTPRIGLHKYSSNLMFGANNTVLASPAQTPTRNERFIYYGDFTSSNSKLYKNGTLIASTTSTYSFSTNTCPTYLFARYCPGSMNYATMRLYNCKIWEGDTLVRHYIPAKNNRTNEVGVYEILNNVFYKNSGSGNFTYGAIQDELAFVPKEYQQVEYIQATGTQRIKLDIQPKSTYKIEERFAITDKSVTSCIWCARGSGTTTTSTTAFQIANSQVRCDYNSSQTNIGTINADQVYTLTMDSNKWYLDNVLKTTSTAATFDTGSKLQLFASHYSGIDANLANWARLKLYSFKVWDDDRELVGNFIPVYRKADNVIGLYDSCSDNFYTNDGTGTFLKGDKTFNNIKDTISFFIAALYAELDYIQATGTQYIDTGIVPTVANETLVTGAFAITDISAGDYQSIGTNMNINFYAPASTLVYRPCGYQTTIALNTIKHDYSLQIKSTGRHVTLDSDNFLGSLPSTVGDYNFYLGAMNGGSNIYYGKYKIYATKIYNSNTLVRDFVPSKRLSDGAIGMYDNVTKTFYENAGSGTFTAGNILNIY